MKIIGKTVILFESEEIIRILTDSPEYYLDYEGFKYDRGYDEVMKDRDVLIKEKQYKMNEEEYNKFRREEI